MKITVNVNLDGKTSDAFERIARALEMSAAQQERVAIAIESQAKALAQIAENTKPEPSMPDHAEVVLGTPK